MFIWGGDRSRCVYVLQAFLRYLEFTDAKNCVLQVDGQYGPRSQAAVISMKKFSQFKNPDAPVGPGTWGQLKWRVNLWANGNTSSINLKFDNAKPNICY